MKFTVITAVADPASGGNLAMGDVYLDPQAHGGSPTDEHKPVGVALAQPMLALYLRVPVFRVGEILVLDHNDRDQFTRKPSKWDIKYETFDSIEDAVACVHRVTND